jgi:ppGpp synthetase/RelA/SpoT-type nucleotidyltranferase
MSLVEVHLSGVEDAALWYQQIRPTYELLSGKVKNILTEVLDHEGISFSSIQARAKTVESFKVKYAKTRPKSPTEIRDLAGIRIILYVSSDVKKVIDLIAQLFHTDLRSIDKTGILGIDKVGYRSRHFIANFPKERTQLAEYRKYDGMFFEIQVATILQHAWAEINHDRNYKFSGILPDEIQRRFNLLSGTLEIIDNEFDRLSNDIEQYTSEVTNKTRTGNLNIPINSTSLREYLKEKVKSWNISGITDVLGEESIDVLARMGIASLSDLDKIVPEDTNEQVIKWRAFAGSHPRLNYGEVLFLMLLFNDIDRTFTALKTTLNLTPEDRLLFTQQELGYIETFGIDTNKMKEYIEVEKEIRTNSK